MSARLGGATRVIRSQNAGGGYPRQRWPTALGLLANVQVPRCRDQAFTRQLLARLDHHRDDLGQSAANMLLVGVSAHRVGELLGRIIR